jgi:acyl-CoA dehydrogenase
MVAEAAERILVDLADPQSINQSTNGAWKAPLWDALSNAGLPLAWVPEHLGGSGASLADGFAVLGVAGRFAVAVPLAETLPAGWLLARAGLEVPATPMTVAPARPHDRITLDAEGRLAGRAIACVCARCAYRRARLSRQLLVIALAETKTASAGRRPQPPATQSMLHVRGARLRSAPAPAHFEQNPCR